jgi:hypothetical protein
LPFRYTARNLPGAVGLTLLIGALSAPVSSNIHFGQISLFILALTLAATTLSAKSPRLSGVLLGLASATKLTPLVFVPMLWVTKRRVSATWAVGTFLALALVAALMLPHDSYTYWSHYVFGQSRYGNTMLSGNQSLLAMLRRSGLTEGLTVAVWIGASALLVFVGLSRARKATQLQQPLAAAAIAGCLSVLISPVSWTHHQGWIVLSASILVSKSRHVQALWSSGLIGIMCINLPETSLHGWLSSMSFLLTNARGLICIVVVSVLPLCGAGLPSSSSNLPFTKEKSDTAASV